MLFTVLYKAVLTFESLNEILTFDHSNESYRAVPPFVLLLLFVCFCFPASVVKVAF